MQDEAPSDLSINQSPSPVKINHLTDFVPSRFANQVRRVSKENFKNSAILNKALVKNETGPKKIEFEGIDRGGVVIESKDGDEDDIID